MLCLDLIELIMSYCDAIVIETLIKSNYIFEIIIKSNKKLYAYRIMSKYLKNCKNKLFYCYYSGKNDLNLNMRDGYSIDDMNSYNALVSSLGFYDKCFYYPYMNITTMITPSFLHYYKIKEKTSKYYNQYHLDKCDLMSSIFIIGNNISKIE